MPRYQDRIMRIGELKSWDSLQLYVCNPWIGGCGEAKWGHDGRPVFIDWKKSHLAECFGVAS